jgi:hypothetical protein
MAWGRSSRRQWVVWLLKAQEVASVFKNAHAASLDEVLVALRHVAGE